MGACQNKIDRQGNKEHLTNNNTRFISLLVT